MTVPKKIVQTNPKQKRTGLILYYLKIEEMKNSIIKEIWPHYGSYLCTTTSHSYNTLGSSLMHMSMQVISKKDLQK